MKGRVHLYFLFGSGCCLPSVLSLSSDECGIDSLGFRETKSVNAADFIIIYGCINAESAKRLGELVKSAPEGIQMIRAGKCIAPGCSDSIEGALLAERINAFVGGCPFDPAALAVEMKHLSETAAKGKIK